MKSIDESLPTPAVPDEIAELTEGLAHEVKNLLAPFRLVLEMITRQVDDARMQKLIGRLRGNADLATQLMDRLAEYGAATTVGNVFVPLGLEPFLREFVDTAEPATDAVAPLHLRLVQPLPEILGCADLIKIALANLVQNSRQAAAPGGALQIRGSGASGRSDPFSRSVIAALMTRHENLHVEFSCYQINRGLEEYTRRFGAGRCAGHHCFNRRNSKIFIF